MERDDQMGGDDQTGGDDLTVGEWVTGVISMFLISHHKNLLNLEHIINIYIVS